MGRCVRATLTALCDRAQPYVQALGPPQLSFNSTSVSFSPASVQVQVTVSLQS